MNVSIQQLLDAMLQSPILALQVRDMHSQLVGAKALSLAELG